VSPTRKDQKKLEEKLAKFKNKSIHDRLTGTSKSTSDHTSDNTSNSTDITDVTNTSISDSNISDSENTSNSKNTSDSNSDVASMVTSMNNNDDTSDVTIDVGSSSTINTDHAIIIDSENKDNSTSTIVPMIENEEKKYVGLYLRKSVAQRFDQFVKDQIKQQKLKNPKIKSFYGDIAIEEFLRKHGYTENKKT
jgi:hypothetical protein